MGQEDYPQAILSGRVAHCFASVRIRVLNIGVSS